MTDLPTPTICTQVADLTERQGIERSRDEAAFLAGAFSRIADIEGDETLQMIADLLKARVILTEAATAMVLAHVRELKAG